MSHVDADAPDGITGNRELTVEPSPGTYSYNGPPDHDLPPMPAGGQIRGNGGWCAPSSVVQSFEEIPPVQVKRGGLQWGAGLHESDCAKAYDADDECDCDPAAARRAQRAEASRESGEYETASEAATRQRWQTARLVAVLLFLLAWILTVRDALPWQ